jgi:hypothetical protein
MTDKQINDHSIKVLLAEASANRLILHALIEAVLPQDQSEAWKDLEAMVSRIETIAKSSAVEGLQKESSDRIIETATELAVNFVRSIGPKPIRQ